MKRVNRRNSLLLACVTAALIGGGAANGFAAESLHGGDEYKRCLPCHSLNTAKHKAGPSLKGVLGRQAGTAKGFNYSKDLKKAGEKGLIWDHESVHEFIENPKKYLAAYLGKKRARTKMKYKYRDKKFRDAVISFIGHANAQPVKEK